MKLSFAKHMKRNIAAGFLNRGIAMVFPFLNRTLFLWLLGPQYLGLNGLFRSVLGVLSLTELGFGTVIVCAMFKPIAEDDRDLVCAYLKFFRNVYRWIGTFVLVAGLCLLPFLRRLIHGDLPPGLDLHLLYLIFLSKSVVSYFFTAYRGPLLSAYHRNDVTLYVQSATQTVQYVTVFLILLLTRNYYAYVLATVAFTVASNLLLCFASVRLFPGIVPRGSLPASARRRVVADVKAICMHKLGDIISFSSDNLVISWALGLTAVAVYGNYYYVVTTAASLVSVLYLFTHGGFGNKIHTESKATNFSLFMRMNRVTIMATTWCAGMMAALFQPFIDLWTKSDPAMLRHALTPALMVLHFYVAQSRQTLVVFKSAAELWQQDRWKPLVGGSVNLALNLSFVLFLPDGYKLDGVIFSTTLSYLLIEQPWETRVLFKTYFGLRRGLVYLFAQVRHAVSAALLCFTTWWIADFVTVPGIPGFLLRALVAAAVDTALLATFHFPGMVDAIDLVRKKHGRKNDGK